MFLTAVIALSIGLFQVRVAESACPGSNTFTCTNGDCVPRFDLCDRKWDCQDVSDEFGCGKCGSDQYSCDQSLPNCIDTNLVCDGHDDCSDGSDEKGFANGGVCPSLGTTTDSYQNTIQSYAYLFFVIPTIALLACLVFVGLCAVVIVLYSKEKFGHRRQAVTNTVDSIAMSTISHHVGRSEQSESPSYVCIHGGDTTKLHCPVVDPPPSYNQTVFSSSPPPPYSSKI